MPELESISIKGFKSIAEVENLPLSAINVAGLGLDEPKLVDFLLRKKLSRSKTRFLQTSVKTWAETSMRVALSHL